MKSLHTKNIKTYGQHLLILAVLSFFIPLNVSASGRESGKEAQDTTIASTKTKTKTSARKIFNGYGGGMMLCGSYLFGTIPQVGYDASGPAFGIGGSEAEAKAMSPLQGEWKTAVICVQAGAEFSETSAGVSKR